MIDPPRFEMVRYETPETDLQRLRGALVRSIHMLAFVRDSLGRAAEREDLEMAVRETELLVESYYQRIYFLRDRVRGLAEALSGIEGLGHKLAHKKQERRDRAIADIASRWPETARSLKRLLDILWPDAKERNQHTHMAYRTMEVHTGTSGYDACDLLSEIQGTAGEASMRSAIRDALHQFIGEYGKGVQSVIHAATEFDEAVRSESGWPPS